MSLLTKEKQEIITEYQLEPNDTGSSSVQIALLTTRIRKLTEHFKSHHKDHHSRRGLLRMINRRKKLLNYLRRTDSPRYLDLIQRLNLRK